MITEMIPYLLVAICGFMLYTAKRYRKLEKRRRWEQDHPNMKWEEWKEVIR
jgi:hypothetical protein